MLRRLRDKEIRMIVLTIMSIDLLQVRPKVSEAVSFWAQPLNVS